MADTSASATGATAASGERRAVATDQPTTPMPTPTPTPETPETTSFSSAAEIQRLRQRAGTTVLEDDGDEEDDDEEESEVGAAARAQRQHQEHASERTAAMTTSAASASASPAVGRAPLPSLVTRTASTVQTTGAINSPLPPIGPPSMEPRNQRVSSAGETGHEWGVDRDEGWMPKPARLHSGKTRSCAVCFAPLQYTTQVQSWDEYVQSSEYLQQLQRNLLSDAFISSLICGESTGGGDLPTEHRMHKNRKTKCRQSVHDYVNMTSAGVIDQAHKEKTSVRILEEMLLYGLSTPLFASVLERRLAVISHSTGIARTLMHQSHVKLLPREVAAPAPNMELHHLAIQTLSALLQSFDYSANASALQAFEEITRLLTCFPALSLYSFWSPAPRFSETPLTLSRSMVEASSTATTPRLLAAEFAIDGSDSSFWQSQPRPGVTYFSVRHPQLSSVSSIYVRWHLKCYPKTLGIQYRVSSREQFMQLTEQAATATSGPECCEVRFPSGCEEIRLVMSGMPVSNRSACYAIEDVKLNMPIANSLFVDPKTTLHDICAWLVKAVGHENEDVVVEAIGALRAWTMATASLSSVLSFVDMLLQVKELYLSGNQPGVVRFAVGQAQTLVRGLQAYRLDESDRIVKGVGKKSTTESRKIRALFEPSCCSAGVTIEDGGMAVRTRETSYQYAAVNAGIASGRASWKFRLDNDTVDDEMTCFGAAILPVTVSGYDSSPNLWMLRGYNGNLYARGHKLNRSVGKVHPGDTVQIDVDMNEGTLAYKINDTEYGAVFTDLVGHEVYPAVSFYGSGKVITLLSVEKWDDADSGSSAFDPIYLSNLKEYHYSVGYGTFGKGTQLGYTSENADVRASAGSTPATSGVIRVSGETKQRSLSTHPPARGDAFVMYDLGHAYSTFAGSVAINDDVQTESLQQRAVAVTFSIVGDGVVLWTSKPLARVRVFESFEVDVINVRILQLRATCAGSNQCAHAIWVDPHLIPLDEWECIECHVMNKGVLTACTLCRTKPTSVGSLGDTAQESVAAIHVAPQSVEVHKDKDQSVDELVNAILAETLELARMDRVANSAIRFEQPFCRQPSQDVLLQLLGMITEQRSNLTNSEVKHRRSLHVLGLLEVNLCSIAAYDVSPQELGIQEDAIDEVKCTLEESARVFKRAGSTSTDLELETAAARALIAGTPILYTPAEKVQLLLVLLGANRETPYPKKSAKRQILSSMLKALSLPGRDGILNFLPSTSRQEKVGVAHELDECTSVPVDDIAEVVSLLIATACNADSLLEENNASQSLAQQSLDEDTTTIAEASMRLLQSYQLMLLAEALEVTSQKSTAKYTAGGGNQQSVRAYIQEATVRFSSLLLRYSGNTIAVLIEQHAEEALLADVPGCQEASAKLRARAFQLPILSSLLPWLVACLCLLRRQAWLAISILPSVVKFSSTLDQFCSELSTVKASESRLRRLERFMKARHIESQELERMLATDAALATHHQASKPMYNVFKQLYTGDKDHFEGQIGFQFEATSTFAIIALGRSVNPTKNGGQLVRQHTIRLWEETTQSLIAQATVGATSRKDALGYAYEPLTSPARLTQGKLYRLTTQEFANGGDPWYKKENLPDEEYDASYVKILRDCYASGSTSFPNSQNLSGAAYGVPTFLVEGENPLKKLPRFLLPFGSTSLKFSARRKSPGNTISHSGTAAHMLDGGADLWRTCFLQTAAYCGHHAADFVVKCGKAGGIAAGHVCVGADWSAVGPKTVAHTNNFLGTSETSIGWMPSVGSIWVMGKRVSYGPRKLVHAGDILTIAIDYDHEVISFAHNGVDLGIAIGPHAYAPKYSLTPGLLPSQLLMGISLNGTLDVVHVRPSGVGGSTLRLHWLLDLHNSISSLAGRVCGTLIAGNPVDEVEEELLPWLQSPLLSGGISRQMAGGREELPEWSAALQEEDARWREASSDPASTAAGHVQPARASDRVLRQQGFPRLAKRSSFFDDGGLEENIFVNDLIQDMGDSGASATIIAWLEKVAPDRSFLSRLGKFPMCERPMCAALIKHSPAHLLHEVQAIILSSKTLDGRISVDHIDLVPSDDLALIWKRLIMLRHWLIKTRQEYRARAANQDAAVDSGESKETNDRSLAGSGQELLEMKVTVAHSFDELVSQIRDRASFLCILHPSSEERERMKVESQQALSNLAEKWSAQKTPPSLEPMLERWRSLRESDSSKWSGIVDVLRAQHRWRRRRASIHIASTLPEGSPIPVEDEEDDEDDESVEDSKGVKYRDTLAAMLRACDLYIRNGVGAPPEILRALLDRRQRRSECRVFGLDAIKTLLSSLSMDSTRHNALMFLRPAFRGFSEDEKESRDLNDGQVIAETFRATVRHHYLKGLEGCSRRTAQRVQLSFWNLYTMLAGLLASGGADTIDTALKQAIVCAWCLDFESRDHSFLLKSGFMTTLQNEFSMGAVLQRTHQEMSELRLLQDATLAPPSYLVHDDLNWYPLSDEFVQRSALCRGLITKRDIMLMVLRAPRYACSTKWWNENVLVAADDASSAAAAPGGSGGAIARHTVSSLSLRYSELLNNLQTKLSWCHEHTLGRKVLQFGLHSSVTASHGTGSQSPAKHDFVSYAEVPALGEVANFTLEMWICPTELGGYRVLRADNGFQTGSVYVELVDRFMHVAINGNHPREQLFKMNQLQTHTWTHVAVVYRAAALSIDYFVNGVHVECKTYTRVNRAIVFRESRIGCWIGDAAGDAAAVLAAGPQRVFKGSIAEIRLWRVSRTAYQIYRDFQRAIPGDIERMHPGPPSTGADARNATTLLGLWHLDEGEGVCGNNRVEATGTTPSQRIMETAGCNASLIACHWAHANVPVWSGANVDLLDNDNWQRVVLRIRTFQQLARSRLAKRSVAMVQYARSINQREEDALMNDWVDDDDDDQDEDDDGGFGFLQSGRSLASQHALAKALSVSTDDVLLHEKHVQRCAWIVFRFLAHVSICGTQERTDSEATSVAAAAKLRRKQRIHSDGATSNVSSPIAAGTRAKATFEEDDVAKTAELASDVAKTAASNRQLEEPVLQMLWFSNEVHRKIFEVLEKELSYATVMIQTAEGLTRAQRMVRSSSTPVKDREIAIRPQQSVVVGSARSGAAGNRGMGSVFSTSRSETAVLEPLEVERHVFGILTFVLSQSTSQVALNHLSRPRVLRELLQLLRLGSPRSQRIVKLILRRICASGVVGPKDVAEIWGSESVLVDLLLDQVAESVCSTAAPLPTLGLSVTAASAAAAASSTITTVSGDAETYALPVAPITESLSNPVGFRSGQVYLAAASESVALLRLLMTDPRWGDVVAELLSAAVRKVTPILARRRSQGAGIGGDQPAASDIRSRTAIIRAVGALCVLGSHTDCIRVGGKVEVTAAKATRGSDGKTMIDYGFNFSNDAAETGARPTLATLIELDSRASTARVVFDGSDESDPSHNVQEINLATMSPVEEVHLSEKAAPLSADMMPVILKLASLDESEVISSFDELWQMQIRSRALLAFESILRHTTNAAAEMLLGGEDAVMPTSLLEAALQPVSLSTFVSVPFLQERGRMILCRLIEASTPFGEPMFRGLPEPTPFQVGTIPNENESVVESSDDPVEEETEAYRVRRGFASTLAAMGFEFDLCMAALEQSRNDPNVAVEWLMGTGAIEYQERQETRRLAEATIASRRAALSDSTSPGDEVEMSLDAKAQELQSISGMPCRLALCALELANADPNRAMEWLMEHGNRYANKGDCMLQLADAIRIESSLSLNDAAALEGIEQADPLVASASHETTVDVAAASPSSSSPTPADPSGVDTTNIMAVTLAPILARLPNKPASDKKPKKKNRKQETETVTGGFAALDPEYLTPYVLLTVSDEIGPVQRLSATGRTGVFRSYCPRDGVLITFLNTETGAYEDEWYAPTDVRRITQIYDEPLDGVASIHRVALRTEKALSTHYARRGVAALLRSWGQRATSTAPRRLSDTVLAAVGGPRQFVNLLKLVAASEMVFSRKPSSSTETLKKKRSFGGTLSSRKSRPSPDESASILHDLQVIALRILREEAESGRLSESTTERLLRNEPKEVPRTGPPDISGTASQPAVERELDSALESTSGFAAPQAMALDDGGADDDGDLYRAVALSMQDTVAAPAVEAQEDTDEDDDQFMERLHSAHPRTLRTRQPSYTEAQEVASAYLGGTIDDHDGLLSSVLVKECVSHFVESTRVAGVGTGSGGITVPVLEFQSLHPYYGRCDYARAVVLDKAHRCVRIKFDKRCMFGPKAKLTFYSDAKCEKVIAVIDASSLSPTPGRTTMPSSISDLLIQSHQFWFKFCASEDDVTKNYGYGFRFRVQPVQSISWANERDVQTTASLEWACWVLEFLLNEATDLVAHGAVHNRQIYGALVRYLRSPGAPFKSRVVRLLVQLLHQPERFPLTEMPDLEPLEGISKLAIAQAKVEKATGKVFVSAQLLQLVELSIGTRRAADVFKQARSPLSASLKTQPSLVLPAPWGTREVPDLLSDLGAVASFLLSKTGVLPPHVLLAIWLDVYGSVAIVETDHPYSSSSSLAGTVHFPHAQSLLATFDSRCATAAGTELKLRVVHEGPAVSPVRRTGSWAFSGLDQWPSAAIDLSGGSQISYTFDGGENPDARFGVSVCISAMGLSVDQQLARASHEKLAALQSLLLEQRDASLPSTHWTTTMDSQLIDWVNNSVENSGAANSNTNASSSSSAVAAVDLKPSDIRLDRTRDALRCTQLLELSLTQLHARFALLKHFNQCLQHTLPLLDLRGTASPWTMAHTLRQLGHCVFFDIKNALVEAAIDATSTPGDTNSSTSTARITLDRLQALESRDDREVEPSVSECFFAQAFRQLHHVDPATFRRKIDNKGRLFSVKFRGEEGVDWGGVYREGVNSMVDDLFSPHFNLFVLCPNGQHDTGTNRAMYLPNPKCTSPVAIQMFEFVGKLLGISLRTRGDFPFAFPSLVWKQLIGEPLARHDLDGTDAMFVQMLDGIQHCARDGILTEAEFDAAFDGLDLKFTAFDCNGQEVELIERGKHTRVTYGNRLEYCQLAERYRLQESATQIAAMARGLATVFPRRVLTLLTHNEMELLTCGSPKIDIALWQQHTRYDGYSESDPTVALFWQAMASFSDEQRSDFVRFAWGRSRLPRGKWPQPFKLTKKGGRDSTLSLPVAHTCFFSVELPPYTTLDKMTTMLLATINFGLGGILMA